jgi:hypothetical protein
MQFRTFSPNGRSGSIATKMGCPPHVCFSPDSDRTADIQDRQLRAITGLMRRSKPLYSITSSARASKEGGTIRPSALAVFMLITNSNLVGCSTGRSAGLAPLRI